MNGSLRTLLATLAALLWATGCRGPGPDKPRAPGAQWRERGVASWYGPGFDGRATASGEIYDQDDLTAAHQTLPFGSLVRVENLDNGRTVDVRINDRGPFKKGRIIDLSRRAGDALGMIGPGTAHVEIRVVGSVAPRQGLFAVQLGAFRERGHARALAARIGPSAEVYSGADGWHRVRTGCSTYDEAQALKGNLARQGFEGLLVACGT